MAENDPLSGWRLFLRQLHARRLETVIGSSVVFGASLCRSVVLCAAVLLFAGCRHAATSRPSPAFAAYPACYGKLELILHPVRPEKPWRIGDVSQRDPNYGECKSDEERQAWREKYTWPVDVVVEIKNHSDRAFLFQEEWNSWGYECLKFVFSDGVHEYWVTKKRGTWYRNFPMADAVEPGKNLYIRVALTSSIWNGLEEVRKNAGHIIMMRALYEQYDDEFYANGMWLGTVSSPGYQASAILPRFYFDFQNRGQKKRTPPADLGYCWTTTAPT